MCVQVQLPLFRSVCTSDAESDMVRILARITPAGITLIAVISLHWGESVGQMGRLLGLLGTASLK